MCISYLADLWCVVKPACLILVEKVQRYLPFPGTCCTFYGMENLPYYQATFKRLPLQDAKKNIPYDKIERADRQKNL